MGTVGGGLGKLFFDDAEEYVDLDAQDYRLPDGTRLTNAMADELADEVERHGLAGRPHLDLTWLMFGVFGVGGGVG